MVGIRGAGEVLLVAAVAIGRQGGVVAVHMALGARRRHVSARQRELGLVVIEGGPVPPRRGVAQGAVGREPAGNVGRISGSLEVRLVAAVAVGGGVVVVAVGMALRTGDRGVLTGEWPLRVEGVIEAGVVPVHRGMADGAIAGQPELDVRRIVAGGEIRLVARIALRRRALEHIIDMA